MASFEELERKFLIEKLQLEESEVFEARFNLLGAFNVLYKIDERLREEGYCQLFVCKWLAG